MYHVAKKLQLQLILYTFNILKLYFEILFVIQRYAQRSIIILDE